MIVQLTNPAMPRLTAPLVDPLTGEITPPWHRLLISLWQRLGGGQFGTEQGVYFQLLDDGSIGVFRLDDNELIGRINTSEGVNWLIGGDFGQNLWQRGNSVDVSGSLGYTADRWFGNAPTSATLRVSRNGSLADCEIVLGGGLVTWGQVLNSENSQALVGQTVQFSGLVKELPQGGVKAFVGWGKGQNQSSGSFAAQGWSGYGEVVESVGAAGQFGMNAEIGSDVTQVGVGFRWSGSGVLSIGQLQLVVGVPPGYLWRLTEVENWLQLAYFWRLREVAGQTLPAFVGMPNQETLAIKFPAAMWRNVQSAVTVVGGWKWNMLGELQSVGELGLISGDRYGAILGDSAITLAFGGYRWNMPGAIALVGTTSSGRVDFSAEL